MNGREKLARALNHQAGPIPIDLGSNAVTGIHCSVVAQLRAHYGLERRPVRINEPYQMLGEIEPDLQEAVGVSVQGVYPAKTMFGFANEGWKEWRTPWGQDVLVPAGFVVTTDRNGDQLIYPEGDTSVSPSGRMPTNGYFFDTIVRQPPVDDDNLKVEENLEEFGPISETDLEYFRREVGRSRERGLGLLANFGGTALGDIALVPAPMLKHPRGIRDIEEWYVSTVARRDYVEAIFRRQVDQALVNLARIYEAVGDDVQAAFLCGTDFGTQSSTFCSVETFESLYLPYYREMTDWIHEHTGWKVFKHSCGAVRPLIESFISAGIDILNPVQISAAGMEPEALKREFGDRIVFWGGGVDTQKTMAFGSTEEVRRQVLHACDVFGTNGGFVFNAVHNVQARSPIENVVAMIEAVHEYNGA